MAYFFTQCHIDTDYIFLGRYLDFIKMHGFWVFVGQRRNKLQWIYAPMEIYCVAFEHPHDKTACAPSEDSDQPGHQPSLIRIFAVRMKKAWVLSYPNELTAKTLIRLGGCPGWSESSLGAHFSLLVLSQGSSFVFVFISLKYKEIHENVILMNEPSRPRTKNAEVN